MDEGILIYFRGVVKPHDSEGPPCWVYTFARDAVVSCGDLFLFISHFVRMAFALVYINAPHRRAPRFLPHFVMR